MVICSKYSFCSFKYTVKERYIATNRLKRQIDITVGSRHSVKPVTLARKGE